MINMIKQRATFESDWNQEQWFHHLVDSDTVVGPLWNCLLNSLGVCRYKISSSLYTIVERKAVEGTSDCAHLMTGNDISRWKMLNHRYVASSSNLGTKLYVFTHLVSLHFTYVNTTRFLMLMFVFVDVSNVQSFAINCIKKLMLMFSIYYAVRGCYTVAV